ncbi:MAG: hypothetical protein NTW87_29405 [Planctomycetota bacterium]|nr:hypothetical protein [Planctomycetota bacterium]
MKVSCPNCNQPLNLPDRFAGKRAKCPACMQSFIAPGGQDLAQAVAAANDTKSASRAADDAAVAPSEAMALSTLMQKEQEAPAPAVQTTAVKSCPGCGARWRKPSASQAGQTLLAVLAAVVAGAVCFGVLWQVARLVFGPAPFAGLTEPTASIVRGVAGLVALVVSFVAARAGYWSLAPGDGVVCPKCGYNIVLGRVVKEPGRHGARYSVDAQAIFLYVFLAAVAYGVYLLYDNFGDIKRKGSKAYDEASRSNISEDDDTVMTRKGSRTKEKK